MVDFLVESDNDIVQVTFERGSTGVGLSLEGGKDSPFGDKPLTIKKIFTGTFSQLSIISVFLNYKKF